MLHELIPQAVPEEQFINSPLFRAVGANGGTREI